jgi:hypothetical protein
MSAGQCKNDPPTGIAGEIYSGWISDADAGLASGITVSNSTLRKLLGAQIESIATVINNHAGGNHTLGTSVNWTLGSGGSGQYSFGAGCPSGSIISITGCDEGGTISFAGGGNTNTGEMFRITFSEPFPSAPAVTLFGADSNGGGILFLNRIHASANSGGFSAVTATAITSGGGALHWIAKGRT